MVQSKEAKDSDKGLARTHQETLALIRVWLDTEIPGSHFLQRGEWLRVNRQVGSLRINLLRSKLHWIETGIVLTE